ncbi:MAG: signal peptidase I [Candidatus Magasanikbacteria bacterium]
MKKYFRFKAFERFLYLVTLFLGVFFFVIFFARFFVISPGRIDGPSMESTFIDEDLFLVNRFTYLFNEPKRYDIVQIVNPDEGKLIVKRIVGLPGEVVVIKRGQVYVGFSSSSAYILDEFNYLDEYTFTTVKGQKETEVFEIKKNEYFLLGDNRPRSIDSRYYGAVSRDKIIGKVVWPH